MYRITTVFILALLPSLISLWLIQRSTQRFQQRMASIRRQAEWDQVVVSDSSFLPEEVSGFVGGALLAADHTCFYSARSPYLRCAVNPSGPCEGCSQYKSRARQMLTR